MLAANAGKVNLVDSLLKFRADPCTTDYSSISPLHYACSNDHKHILLLLRKTNIEWSGKATTITYFGLRANVTPLHIAASLQDRSILEYLFDEGLVASVDGITNMGETPLTVAAGSGNPRNVY